MYGNFKSHRLLPAQAKAHTPLDSEENARFGAAWANMLWVETSGDVVLVLENDDQVTFKSVVPGQWHYMPPFKRVQGSGTSAGEIVVGVSY